MRILLVNEIRLVCNLLASVLEDEPDMEVAGCATSVEDALKLAGACDVILVNAQMGIEATRELFAANAGGNLGTKILVFGLTETEKEVLRFVQAGAFGYILKDDSVEELVLRIRSAHEDKVLLNPRIAAALTSRVAELAQHDAGADVELGYGDAGALGELTPREHEIVALISQGLSNQEIADKLIIEIGTVKNHVHNILTKLNASNRYEAAAFLAMYDGE
jgi:two-component system nitrate/nitrite response regulator NarL